MSLHANWNNSALHVWGDAATADANGERAHPPADALREAVAESSGDALLASVGEPSELRLRLPREDALIEVTVPTLRFAATEAIDLLIACCPAAESRTCDDSIRYWATLARHVTQRVAAQQFFPDLLERRDGDLEATWRLLVGDTDDIRRLERFAESMPPVCRAIATAGESPDATSLVESFLSRTADGLIRRDVSHDPFFSRVHELATAEGASAEVRWMSALLGNDRRVNIDDPYESRDLAERVRGWVGRLEEQSAASPWQIEFVLEEPDEDEDAQEQPWNVALRFRPAAEDAEPVDPAELWDERGETGAILGRKLAARREQVRAGLAAAAEVFPPLSAMLQSPAPANVRLSTPEAHLFIRQWAPQLRDRGFLATLPDWASARDVAPGLLLSISPMDEDEPLFMTGGSRPRTASGGPTTGDFSTGHFGLDSLLNFDWQIAVGDLRFSPDEFARLAERRVPLVRHGGQWVQLDLEAADRAAKLLEKKKAGQMTLAEAFRTAFTSSAADGVPVVGLHGTSWVGQLLEQAPTTHVQSLTQPAGFEGTLRPYQLRGLDWLSFLSRLGIGGCLADDMGLGKTIQLIALMLHEREEIAGRKSLAGTEQEINSSRSYLSSELQVAGPAGGGESSGDENSSGSYAVPSNEPSGARFPGPTLLFAPTSVVGNWTKELSRFAKPLKVLVHHGPERLHGEIFAEAASAHDVVITSYALAHRDVEDLRRVAWHRLALDEAQKIKNPYAAATLAIRSLAAPHRVALTGTPIENRLSELWSIMDVLNPGLLGTAAEFRDRFAMPIEKLVDQDRAGQLRKLIQPFVLRRTKSDPLIAGDLPEKMEMKVYCNLTPEQAAMYQQITTQMLGQVDAADGIRRRALVLAALTRLKQVCDHPGLLTDKDASVDGRSGKAERIVEMLEEVIEEGDSALIFTQFREMGHLLEQILARRLRIPVPFLHGGTPAKQRDVMIDNFQKPGEGSKVFLLSLRAGGLGLNLTNANHVFHFDRWWNPAVESQATDRAHRIGQTRKVQVHKFVCIGTVEERIDQLLSEKVALADRIVGSGDEWLTNLSTEDLRKTLELSASAVAEY